MHTSAHTLVNPQNGNLAFKLFSFEGNSCFDHVQRYNYYSVIWITEGSGRLRVDVSAYDFAGSNMFFFSPCQPFMTEQAAGIKGIALHFHPDFFCVYKHQAEVACNGVLYNNIYEPPFISIDEPSAAAINPLLQQMIAELQNPALAQYELLVSYLKILLITATRIKVAQQPMAMAQAASIKEPFVLQNLKDAIETNYRTKHSASDYAAMLNISAKALAKVAKNYFSKTVTDLIAERIIIEAKRELYLTEKPVKQIAYELGYNDEFYFSRFFKNNTAISPQLFRETVGHGKGIERTVN
jgi:AraC family transcriptional regulator, transcriptional activator of pobA